MDNHSDDFESKLLHLESVKSILQKIHPNENVAVKSYNVELTGELCGYLGDHYKVQIKYSTNNIERERKLFYKACPKTNPERTKYIEKYGFFRRELFFYNTIQTQFREFNDDHQWSPKCYLAEDEKLVFEDLNLRGFGLKNWAEPLDESHIFRVMESLARFHGSSIILEETKQKEHKNYNLKKEYGGNLNKGHYNENQWFQNSLKDSLVIAGESKQYGNETLYYDLVKSNWDKTEKAVHRFVGPSDKYRNVIVHMDLWINNMMFRYDENGSPLQCIFVDFQQTNVCPPAVDIATFLYLAVDKTLRDSSFEDYLKHYHRELKNVLIEAGIDVETALPWKELTESFQDCRVWGLLLSVVLYQFFFTDKDEMSFIMNDPQAFDNVVHGSRCEYLLNAVRSNEMFKNKMIVYIDELIKLLVI